MQSSFVKRFFSHCVASNTTLTYANHSQSFKSKASMLGLSGLMLTGAMTMVGCDKKTQEPDPDEPVTQTEVVDVSDASVTETEVEAPVIACDDQVALSQLTNAIQTAVSTQTEQLLTTYADRADLTLDSSKAKTASKSILVDVANANPVPSASTTSAGMTTCQAKLSLTLPNQDVTRATSVYDRIEADGLSNRLSAMNITLNNNMLVNDSFVYIVGLQGGQAVARVVGQPDMIRMVADMLAKSQFKVAMDASRPVIEPATNSAPSTPNRTQNPAPTNIEPTPRPKPVAPPSQAEPTEQVEPKPQPQPEPKPAPNPATNTEPSIDAPEVTDNTEFSVPTDDSIDMVIIQEEGTY